MSYSFDFNPHEYLTYILCSDLCGYHPLNEERGRIPLIQKLLDELESMVTTNLDAGSDEKIMLPYTPSFKTFFQCLNLSGNVKIVDDPLGYFYGDTATGQFKPSNVVWHNSQILSFKINFNIVSPKSRFSFNFRRTIGHELLHAYEYYNKRLNGVSFDTSKSGNYNAKLQSLMNSEEPRHTLAFLYYLNQDKELRAYSQGIQNEYYDLTQRLSLDFLRLPFEYIKSNITEYYQLEGIKDGIEYCYLMFDKQTLLSAMSEVSEKQITNFNQMKSIIDSLLTNIEQAYDKALSRAIEDYAINKQGATFSHQDMNTLNELRRKLKDIYMEYGYPSNIKEVD